MALIPGLRAPARRMLAVVAVLVIAATDGARAQLGSPVAVDDSPWASEQLRRAADQAAVNPAEAVRLLQRVLEEQPSKVVPWPEQGARQGAERGAEQGADQRDPGDDRFRAAREVANALLRERRQLVDRYRERAEPAARRQLEAGDLQGAWRSALMTPSGLRAALRIAQDDLERGRFHSARLRIAEVIGHPDLTGDLAIHAEIMDGLASAALRDLEGAMAAITALRPEDGAIARAGRDAVERLLAGGPLPTLRRGTGSLDQSPTPPPRTEAPWLLLDEQLMPTSPFARGAGAMGDLSSPFQRDIDRLRNDGSLLAAVATSATGTVWINDGATVRAFDGLSGRVHWVRELSGSSGRLDEPRIGDVNAVAVEGDALVTLAGHAGPIGRSGGNRIVCLDARSGEPRWSATPSALLGGLDGGFDGDGDLATTFPHGAPVIREGIVFVLLRKVTTRIETVSYLAAIDVETGRARWVRHICTSSGLRLGSTRAYSSPTWSDGFVFVALSNGAAACFDASTGEIEWLHRLPVPVREPRFETQPWEIAAPMLLGNELFIVAPDQLAALVLDRHDGRQLATLPLGRSDTLGVPRYFVPIPAEPDLGVGELALAVGSDLICFDPASPTVARWSLSRLPGMEHFLGDERSGIRGRVHLAGRSAIVPLRDRVLRVDCDSGDASVLVMGTGPGNPLIVGPQLLLAVHDRIESYMPFAEAERHLRERLESDPSSADHGLALIVLGSRGGSLTTCVDGARAAMIAIERDPDPRRADAYREELFERLLAVSDDVSVSGPSDPAIAPGPEALALGEDLHAMLEGLAGVEATPRATALLARAAWRSRNGASAGALADLRSVRDEEGLASVLVVDAGVDRAASIVARSRLAALLEADDAAAAALEFEAATLLASISREAPRALADQALRFAGTLAADGAGREALEALRQAGRVDEAAALAMRFWRAVDQALPRNGRSAGSSAAAPDQPPRHAARTREVRARAAGLVVEMLTAADAPVRADRFLAMLASADPDAVVATTGTAESPVIEPVAATRERLATYGSDRDLDTPVVGTFRGESREVPGRLLRGIARSDGRPALMRSDRVLIGGPEGIRMLDDSLEERWTLALDDTDPRVLRFDETELLLWSSAGGEPVALLVDAEDGRILWMSPRFVGSAADAADGAGTALAADAAADASLMARDVQPILSGRRLMLVRRTGDVVAFDLRAPGSPAWQRSGVVGAVHSVCADDGLLLVAGADTNGDSVVVSLDARTGDERVRHPIQSEGRIRWSLGTADGLAVAATTRGIEAFDPIDGLVAWRTRRPSLGGTEAAWSAGEWIVFADAAQRLGAIRSADGASPDSSHFTLGAAAVEQPLLRDVVVDDSGVLVLFDQRVAEFGHAGERRGIDASVDARDFRFLLVGGSRLLVVGAAGSEQVDVGGGRRTRYSVRVQPLDRLQGCKLVDSALQVSAIGQRFERATLIDGWLLLSTASATSAIPLPPAQ